MMIMEFSEALCRVVFVHWMKVQYHWNYLALLILEKRENWMTQAEKTLGVKFENQQETPTISVYDVECG